MSKIYLIDDDYSTESIVENLAYRGFDARRIGSASEALNSVEELIKADLIILDIIMERPQGAETSKFSGDKTTGMTILKALREKNPSIPILILSATADRDLIDAATKYSGIRFLSKWSSPSLKDVLDQVEGFIGGKSNTHLPRCFIVHGHDEVEKLALKNFLQNALKFPEPMILHELASQGRTIIEKLENYAHQTDLVFVLLTPDDKIASGQESNDGKRRARQNVIFELGYFLGVMGRLSGRVFLLFKGPLDLPSDLLGVVYIDISKGVEAAGESIRKEIDGVLKRE